MKCNPLSKEKEDEVELVRSLLLTERLEYKNLVRQSTCLNKGYCKEVSSVSSHLFFPYFCFSSSQLVLLAMVGIVKGTKIVAESLNVAKISDENKQQCLKEKREKDKATRVRKVEEKQAKASLVPRRLLPMGLKIVLPGSECGMMMIGWFQQP